VFLSHIFRAIECCRINQFMNDLASLCFEILLIIRIYSHRNNLGFRSGLDRRCANCQNQDNSYCQREEAHGPYTRKLPFKPILALACTRNIDVGSSFKYSTTGHRPIRIEKCKIRIRIVAGHIAEHSNCASSSIPVGSRNLRLRNASASL